jgi:hypothetical protein
MEGDDIFLYLNPIQSIEKYPNNSPEDFTVNLAKEINLIGNWQVCLTDITFREKRLKDFIYPVYICTDIANCSLVGERQLPILGQIALAPKKSTKMHSLSIKHLKYISVRTNSFKDIRVYIISEQDDDKSFISNPLSCILRLRKTF